MALPARQAQAQSVAPQSALAMGMTEMPGQDGKGVVTVFYPTSGAQAPVQRFRFTFNAALDAAPQRGNGRLVVVSHGTGGAPWVHTDLARALVQAGYVVAMPEHRGDNNKDDSDTGPESYKRRPGEVSRAIDVVAADARFAPLLALDKVGMYGFSAGGHTALSLAGGRWSPARFLAHCEAHLGEDFASCVGIALRLTGGPLDGLKKSMALGVLRQRFSDATWYTHEDPRIKAIVAAAPAAMDFDASSLATPHVPLGLITLGQDKWLTPQFHSGAILAACKTCTVVADLPTAGHGAMLSPPPPMNLLPSNLVELLQDPPGFDRAQLPEVNRKVVGFLSSQLLP
ncbi:MAG: dienelactone hydrolase family protein [Ramlibacter sp.]|nr:dienelactone hydrolase family protein [Ramlibacter sp.]